MVSCQLYQELRGIQRENKSLYHASIWGIPHMLSSLLGQHIDRRHMPTAYVNFAKLSVFTDPVGAQTAHCWHSSDECSLSHHSGYRGWRRHLQKGPVQRSNMQVSVEVLPRLSSGKQRALQGGRSHRDTKGSVRWGDGGARGDCGALYLED